VIVGIIVGIENIYSQKRP